MTRRTTLLAGGILFFSMSLLIFEISLTRIFSIILNYHYVFVIISFALLGLGIGGILFFGLQRWDRIQAQAGIIGVHLTVIAIPVVVYGLVTMPLANDPGTLKVGFFVYILLANLPFVFGGLGLSWLFQQYANQASVLYAADLAGAGLGALAAWGLLQAFGGPGTALFAGLSGAIAVGLFTLHQRKHPASIVISFTAASGFLMYFLLGAFPSVPVGADQEKDMYRLTEGAEDDVTILESKWSAFGRTDLVKDPRTPHQLVLFIDGAAGTPMIHQPEIFSDSTLSSSLSLWGLQFFPFAFLEETEKDSALIIGPGGGKDVVITRMAGVKHTTAVEVNPEIVSLVRQYAGYNGNIYQNDNSFRLVVGEGRQFVRRSEKKYDVIMLAIPVTKSKRSYEGYALTEDFLFTVEAIQDYLDHLTPEGRLMILAHGEPEVLRLVLTTIKAFENRGIGEEAAMRHLYTISDGMLGLLVVKKSEFTEKEARIRHDGMHRYQMTAQVSYFPYIQQRKSMHMTEPGMHRMRYMFNPTLFYIARDIYSSKSAFFNYPFDVSPVTDDRPFFYDFKRGLPSTITSIFLIFASMLVGLLWKATRKQPGEEYLLAYHNSLKSLIGLFSLLGMGYMMAEIALFQKLLPYFGNPTLALSVLLAMLLMGSGVGSLISQRIPVDHILSKCRLAAAGGGGLLLLFLVLMVRLPFTISIWSQVLPLLLLFSAGIFLGFLFPLLVRYAAVRGLRHRIPWFWGINGVASVTGSVLAVILAKWFGWTVTLGLAGCIYLLIAILVHKEQNKVFVGIPLDRTRSMIATTDMSGVLADE